MDNNRETSGRMWIPFYSESPATNISYREELRDFLRKNAPLDFDRKMARATPFLFASFISWPAFWLYKGLEWSNQAHMNRSLINYINRTFHQAKLMQFAILGAGVLFSTYQDSPFLHNISNMLHITNDEGDARGDWQPTMKY